MKDFVKFAVVGVAGYLIGFFEMKYKVTKVMLEGMIENSKANKNKKEL